MKMCRNGNKWKPKTVQMTPLQKDSTKCTAFNSMEKRGILNLRYTRYEITCLVLVFRKNYRVALLHLSGRHNLQLLNGRKITEHQAGKTQRAHIDKFLLICFRILLQYIYSVSFPEKLFGHVLEFFTFG